MCGAALGRHLSAQAEGRSNTYLTRQLQDVVQLALLGGRNFRQE